MSAVGALGTRPEVTQRLCDLAMTVQRGLFVIPLLFPGTDYWKAIKTKPVYLELLETIVRARSGGPGCAREWKEGCSCSVPTLPTDRPAPWGQLTYTSSPRHPCFSYEIDPKTDGVIGPLGRMSKEGLSAGLLDTTQAIVEEYKELKVCGPHVPTRDMFLEIPFRQVTCSSKLLSDTWESRE